MLESFKVVVYLYSPISGIVFDINPAAKKVKGIVKV